ncbi:YkvA family protein [Thermogemmatispora onikobensis]|uniref:YkvA family protein n=1 Tax=Thermogemmatispora onikobensis TaxID=732234 RepID=UPI000853DD46|nr:DUF1232 domain-containing protein [Thermogemmatispora onikobensis]
MQAFRARWQGRIRSLRQEIQTLILAYRDPRLPWYHRLLLLSLLSYALSPIDLIPDFIPIVGHLDDLVILPLGMLLAIKLLPPAILEESRARAAQVQEQPCFRGGIVLVLGIWGLGVLFLCWVLSKLYPAPGH